MIDTLQWTPTANLKLLLKAASPDLHSREVLHRQNSVKEVFWSKTSVAIPDVTVANNTITDGADIHAENFTVPLDKQRRKDKSLGLLCEK